MDTDATAGCNCFSVSGGLSGSPTVHGHVPMTVGNTARPRRPAGRLAVRAGCSSLRTRPAGRHRTPTVAAGPPRRGSTLPRGCNGPTVHGSSSPLRWSPVRPPACLRYGDKPRSHRQGPRPRSHTPHGIPRSSRARVRRKRSVARTDMSAASHPRARTERQANPLRGMASPRGIPAPTTQADLPYQLAWQRPAPRCCLPRTGHRGGRKAHPRSAGCSRSPLAVWPATANTHGTRPASHVHPIEVAG